jgi:muconolactone delta-isomerase
MQILALERELKPIDAQRHADVLREEAAHIWALKKQSVIREIWFTVPDRRAVVLLECVGEEDAKRHLARLPLVREGLIAFEVFALRSYDGLDRLVEGGPRRGPT